jgi:hypothetical protein
MAKMRVGGLSVKYVCLILAAIRLRRGYDGQDGRAMDVMGIIVKGMDWPRENA